MCCMPHPHHGHYPTPHGWCCQPPRTGPAATEAEIAWLEAYVKHLQAQIAWAEQRIKELKEGSPGA